MLKRLSTGKLFVADSYLALYQLMKDDNMFTREMDDTEYIETFKRPAFTPLLQPLDFEFHGGLADVAENLIDAMVEAGQAHLKTRSPA